MGLRKLEIVRDAFEKHHKDFLKTTGDVMTDARSLVCCVLGYNVLFNRNPK